MEEKETTTLPRWIVVSNRLPFRWDAQAKRLEPASGGLITAISGIQTVARMTWVGVAPDGMTPEDWDTYVKPTPGPDFQALFLSAQTYSTFYNGMCNNALWPLLHYETTRVHFNKQMWQTYQAVNQAFANHLLTIATEIDLIWIQDFHLFLVSKFLKEGNSQLRVGFFLHTPFPSFEIFGQIPVREEILQGVLTSDLIGFHDYSYLRHFCNSARYYLGLEPDMLSINVDNHTTQLGVFPVSIDTPRLRAEAVTAEVQQLTRRLRRKRKHRYLVLGVDRLDYTKGLTLKLQAFREFLMVSPEMRGEVVLMQIAIPTRTDVPEYIDLRRAVEQLVGEINGTFGKLGFTPVEYIFSSVSFHELLALYRLANVLLVTSTRDGMNLVALEYIATQPEDDPGVVVLSEFTGAMSALSQVVHTNPWDIERTAEKLFEALTMAREERISRHQQMMAYLDHYTATSWAQSFTASLASATSKREVIKGLLIGGYDRDSEAWGQLLKELRSDKPLLIFIDYDGTLVPIRALPEKPILLRRDYDILRVLSQDPRLKLVIVSGRSQDFLIKQFHGLNIDIAAEHGGRYFDVEHKRWRMLVRQRADGWKKVARQILSDYSLRVPGSFVEEKQFSLVWHYRLAPLEFADSQARKLLYELNDALSNQPVSAIAGKKVIEIRVLEANKGVFINWYLRARGEKGKLNHIIALGDDETDEEMFAVLERRGGVAIKVGREATGARYKLASSKDVLPFVVKLVEAMFGAKQ